jgi:hypothetical protein
VKKSAVVKAKKSELSLDSIKSRARTEITPDQVLAAVAE